MGEQDWGMLSTELIALTLWLRSLGVTTPIRGTGSFRGTGQRGILAGRSDERAACVGGRD
jgi:hypothetical protein